MNRLNPSDLRKPGSKGPGTCQKCLKSGHWTYECKEPKVYASRPSRSAQLLKPIEKKPQGLAERDGLADDILNKRRKLEEQDESENSSSGSESGSNDNNRSDSSSESESGSESEEEPKVKK